MKCGSSRSTYVGTEQNLIFFSLHKKIDTGLFPFHRKKYSLQRKWADSKKTHLQNSMNSNLVLESALHSGVLEGNILLTSHLTELGGSHSPESYVHFI